MDERNKILAKNLVNYSCNLQKGEKVLIEATGVDNNLVSEIIDAVYEIGGYPFYRIYDYRLQQHLIKGTSVEHCNLLTRYMLPIISEMDAYIGIAGGNNLFELAEVSDEKKQTYNIYYSKPIHHDVRVTKTKWVILRYPTEGMSQEAKMSTEAFEDFFYKVCNLDYSKMDKALQNLKILMDKTEKVKIISPNTNITFSIKGIPSVVCSGHMNIPDGEIYTAPVKNSVNGIITYNIPTIYNGIEFNNVCLEVEEGKIIKATSSNTEKLNEILNTDAGARYFGEFAFGVNPHISKPILDILFDEKMKGSIHFTPGSCYLDAFNSNDSAVHWDLILNQTKEYGGGEIYFDNVLVRKDGNFVLPELLCLNPENLI